MRGLPRSRLDIRSKETVGNTERPPCQFVKRRMRNVTLKRVQTKDRQQELNSEVKLMVGQTNKGKITLIHRSYTITRIAVCC